MVGMSAVIRMKGLLKNEMHITGMLSIIFQVILKKT